MRYFRIYADADGASHFEDLDVALRPAAPSCPRSTPPAA